MIDVLSCMLLIFQGLLMWLTTWWTKGVICKLHFVEFSRSFDVVNNLLVKRCKVVSCILLIFSILLLWLTTWWP
jgi:hypothetical protein